MAVRPVYVPMSSGLVLVDTQMIDFTWHSGQSKSQKQKSIFNLHKNAKHQLELNSILEVSSKSIDPTGSALSAFNLSYKGQNLTSVECIYQASKVFENGGAFRDLANGSSLDAKRDYRLKSSGRLIMFTSFSGEDWPLDPLSLYYDWVYLNVLSGNPDLHETLNNFNAFTDIEFNPKRSFNCQAYSVALFCALKSRKLINEVLQSRVRYEQILNEYVVVSAEENNFINPKLI